MDRTPILIGALCLLFAAALAGLWAGWPSDAESDKPVPAGDSGDAAHARPTPAGSVEAGRAGDREAPETASTGDASTEDRDAAEADASRTHEAAATVEASASASAGADVVVRVDGAAMSVSGGSAELSVHGDDETATGRGTVSGAGGVTGTSTRGRVDDDAAAEDPEPEGPAPFVSFDNQLGMHMVWVDPGHFMMGSEEGEPERGADEGPAWHVSFHAGFWVAETEVTQGQWVAAMGELPGYLQRTPEMQSDERPVTHVSWHDAVAFCELLSDIEGFTYRLPKETEWEYACRAGTQAPWSFGDATLAGEEYAWYAANHAELYPPEAGTRAPNAWGLYDMHGSVSEWCEDWYAEYPLYPSPGLLAERGRVTRGGNFRSRLVELRSAARRPVDPNNASGLVGFRPVCVPPE